MIERQVESVEVQWQVVWFPDDVPEVVRRGSEAHAHSLARKHAQFHPIVSSRMVTTTAWRTEQNYADK